MHMKNIYTVLALFVILGTASCKTRAVRGDDGKMEIYFLQVNDVYEIAPLAAGKEGGIARIATLKKQYAQKNNNSFLVMAGDFLSPSVYNSLQYNGKPVRGKQMVESLNAAKLDLAVFGNHEFDIRENELLERIDESDFLWFSSNSFHKKGNTIKPFTQKGKPLPSIHIMDLLDNDGTRARIGFISVTLPFNRADYVSYTDPLATAKQMYDKVKDSVDAVIAITHQAISEDIELAKALPGLAMILGGHEHDNRFEKVGNVHITKAHANARSAYVLKLDLDKKKNSWKVKPELVYLDESVPMDSSTQVVVEKWTKIADENFSSLGFNAGRVVIREYSGETLDGRETEVRRRSTGLTKLIVRGIEFAAPRADLAIMNGGSIRVDDVLHTPLTEYDILRTLPFGGSIREVDMRGDVLSRVLDQGLKNIGSGGFLQVSETVELVNGIWLLNKKPIESTMIYRVALSEFLLTGKEAGLDFLDPSNPGIVKVHEDASSRSDARYDIRLALIRYLDSLYK
jgi:2',3'-cyclic-nucleotide 2'-phosphodiesterase (5'-nucleotidase family)